MKIICVGWNYPLHNKEMNRALVNEEPTLFLKPDTALLRDGKPFYLPDFAERFEYEGELVVRICRLGKDVAEKFASRYYDAVTVGVDMTARDLQARLRAAGQPWEIAKGFDNSAIVGEFVATADLPAAADGIDFRLDLNGETVQHGNSRDMNHSIDHIVAYVSRFFTLKMGDLIFTGTPAGVGAVKIDDHLQGFIGDRCLLDFHVR
jgi:2-keto-4-pentenoate hydratase/2-oxohepta-3-ene-1,7-dioic acid hydratase in catechol pathway